MVSVPVMDIREVRVLVAQPAMLVLVTVRLFTIPVEGVLMLMMVIMGVSMRMQ